MPAIKFICPDGKRIDIADCLRFCPKQQRCMFLPTLCAIAKSLDRKISEPTVTELIFGTRETFLEKTTDYAVDPASILYALHGQTVHSINERHTQGSILSEERLKDEITSGQFDLFGKILDADDGVRDLLDWAIQLNAYRMLLERAGFKVNRMVIEALCRDSGLRIATERGITKSVYIILINKISDHWLQLYFQHKAKAVRDAIESNNLPPVCSFRERWGNRKCLGYCAARENCPYAQKLITTKEESYDELQLSA